MNVISTYEFTRTVEFVPNEDGTTLKGVTICGPGRDQRRYYAVFPQKGEGVLTLEILEEALEILRVFSPEKYGDGYGYNFVVDKLIPDTIEAIVNKS